MQQKIVLLGSGELGKELVIALKRLGEYVVACDSYEGAPAMQKSIEQGEVITLEEIDKFVDGAAVKRVGDITFEICREVLDRVITVPEGMFKPDL